MHLWCWLMKLGQSEDLKAQVARLDVVGFVRQRGTRGQAQTVKETWK
jgi:hypothetical protein